MSDDQRLRVFEEYIHTNACSDEGGYFAFFTPGRDAEGNPDHGFFDERVSGCASEEEAIHELAKLAAEAIRALRMVRDSAAAVLDPEHGAKFPCKISEMQEREYQIAQVSTSYTGTLTFVRNIAEEVLGRKEEDF